MPCPSAEELAALYDCVLPKEQAAHLRDHLSGCPRCAADVSSLARLLDCPEPTEGLSAAGLARAKRLATQPPEVPAGERPHPPARSPSKPASTSK